MCKHYVHLSVFSFSLSVFSFSLEKKGWVLPPLDCTTKLAQLVNTQTVKTNTDGSTIRDNTLMMKKFGYAKRRAKMTRLYSMNTKLSNHDDGTNTHTHINITHIHTLYVLSTGEKAETDSRTCVWVCVYVVLLTVQLKSR